MGNGCVNAASLRPPFGSPERGAVAARSGVTEGLVQRWCGKTTLPVNRLRAGVEARPYDVWEGGCDKPEYPAAHRGRCALRRVGRCQRKTEVVCHPEEGASRTPPPTGVSETNVAAYDVTGALSHASQMERGRCPRDCKRGEVDGGGSTVGDAGAIGHAGHPRQHCPGGHVTMVHRGRCTLRVGAYRTLRHET